MKALIRFIERIRCKFRGYHLYSFDTHTCDCGRKSENDMIVTIEGSNYGSDWDVCCQCKAPQDMRSINIKFQSRDRTIRYGLCTECACRLRDDLVRDSGLEAHTREASYK